MRAPRSACILPSSTALWSTATTTGCTTTSRRREQNIAPQTAQYSHSCEGKHNKTQHNGSELSDQRTTRPLRISAHRPLSPRPPSPLSCRHPYPPLPTHLPRCGCGPQHSSKTITDLPPPSANLLFPDSTLHSLQRARPLPAPIRSSPSLLSCPSLRLPR